jgi:hypothetical protein
MIFERLSLQSDWIGLELKGGEQNSSVGIELARMKLMMSLT